MYYGLETHAKLTEKIHHNEGKKLVQSLKTMHKIPRQKKTKPSKFNSCENKEVSHCARLTTCEWE